MDGTGRLFRRFVAHAPPGLAPEVVALPAEPLSYAALAARLAPALRLDRGCVLVAESFSGPLAARLAAEHAVGALVLCNTFVAPPRGRALRGLASPALFRWSPPRWVVRHLLVGPDAPPALVDEVRAAIASVPSAVLAARLAEVLRADAGAWLARSSAPLLDLRGTADRLVPERCHRRVAAARPAAVARVAGPHFLLQAAPERAWAAITAWLHGEAGALLPPRGNG